MRIAIANPTGGGLSGGYQKYLNRLVPELSDHPAVSALRVFVPTALTGRLRADLPVESVNANDWARAVREFGADVVFVPTARVVRVAGLPLVTMMRNMEPVTVPFAGNTWTESLRNLGRAAVALRACHSADAVIAVSEYVGTFLRERWHVGAERIAVVPHGVDPPQPPGRWHRPAQLPHASAPFLFTAGSIRPARGLRSALDAFGRLASDHSDLRLVIAGEPTPDAVEYARTLRARAAELDVSDRVDWVGNLAPAEMAWCFGHALVFIMSSRAEACPNIALEALSHGCLVVSTPRPPMPEFFGDAAVYAHAQDDAAALCEALGHVLRDPDRFAPLRRAAMLRASRYTWGETARRTVEELERVVRARGTGRAA